MFRIYLVSKKVYRGLTKDIFLERYKQGKKVANSVYYILALGII